MKILCAICSTKSCASVLEPSGGDFFLDHVRENAAGFELCQLGEDARLGSRGEGYRAVDEMAVNDSVESENFLPGLRVHR